MSFGELKYALNDTIGTANFAPLNRQHGKAVFTANGTFTVPSWVTEITVSACASGSNGAPGGYNGSTGAIGGNGGNCGEFFESWVPVTPGMSIPIVVGIGNTVVGDTVLLKGGGKYKGGLGSAGDTVGKNFRSGGGGGGASGPFDRYPGDGLGGGICAGGIAGGALGNLSNGRPIGFSGLKGVDGESGISGSYVLSGGPGGGGGCGHGAGGGGGGGSSVSANAPGGAGAPGIVIIEW